MHQPDVNSGLKPAIVFAVIMFGVTLQDAYCICKVDQETYYLSQILFRLFSPHLCLSHIRKSESRGLNQLWEKYEGVVLLEEDRLLRYPKLSKKLCICSRITHCMYVMKFPVLFSYHNILYGVSRKIKDIAVSFFSNTVQTLLQRTPMTAQCHHHIFQVKSNQCLHCSFIGRLHVKYRNIFFLLMSLEGKTPCVCISHGK